MSTKSFLPEEPLPGKTDAGNLPKNARKPKTALPTKPSTKKSKQTSAVATGDMANAKTAAIVNKPVKEDKPPKIKLVRDSFTMPENDYAQFADIKKRCLQAGLHVKKSELLRAGLTALNKLADDDLVKVMKQVEILKTGRPAERK